jgi:hypothetical protein
LEIFCPTRIASFGSIVLRRWRAWDKGIPWVSRISFDNLHHHQQSIHGTHVECQTMHGNVPSKGGEIRHHVSLLPHIQIQKHLLKLILYLKYMKKIISHDNKCNFIHQRTTKEICATLLALWSVPTATHSTSIEKNITSIPFSQGNKLFSQSPVVVRPRALFKVV